MDKLKDSAISEPQLGQSLERTALDGAAAIQRIISERDRLRRLTESQQAETMRLRGASEDFQRRLLEIRKHYLELATEILGQFEKFDSALREATKDLYAAPSPTVGEAPLGIVQDLESMRSSGIDSRGGF